MLTLTSVLQTILQVLLKKLQPGSCIIILTLLPITSSLPSVWMNYRGYPELPPETGSRKDSILYCWEPVFPGLQSYRQLPGSITKGLKVLPESTGNPKW